jgi:hypothetical protein
VVADFADRLSKATGAIFGQTANAARGDGGHHFGMTTPPATARFLLFPQVGEDVRESQSVKIRRYRLSRVELSPPASGGKATFDHLKQAHD